MSEWCGRAETGNDEVVSKASCPFSMNGRSVIPKTHSPWAKSDGISKGNYQVAKWNGTKVSVKILDKDSYSDPESIQVLLNLILALMQKLLSNMMLTLWKKYGFLMFKFVGAVTKMYLEDLNHISVIGVANIPRYQLQGDLRSYLQKKGRLSPSKALRFALDIARQMMEGVQPFYPKPPEEAVKLMCVDVQRPTFKTKSKYYPPDPKDLIEECWYPDLSIRPKFSEIIIRLDKIVGYSSKQGWFKDTFKLPWK
ncbi:integrin-linked protein kinase family protein [Tanacetum coccineum]